MSLHSVRFIDSIRRLSDIMRKLTKVGIKKVTKNQFYTSMHATSQNMPHLIVYATVTNVFSQSQPPPRQNYVKPPKTKDGQDAFFIKNHKTFLLFA
ncbi:MAG: hypothetical protein A2845_03140 [Candidatus Lloydbacteria bacterium RIFCSPHIGHO2_01_FULL_49_22]|uniref:Uncharacterized protein n=1 Tax=Candidatus Lloydbacteria bacterium RIFCSPHIGHO2_01_FULL_49_22 TaxID=1798658 RepID=A0A1G2CVM6_9BACT|nr:MAG: hypothetical protein A2845_03140 [Candidatus Lloydbacteria bacterium RIFCSPHIGHO2_01_FULL_49_22]OGZ09875.1 MAG: hypothetical protein A3C14_02975 [Candidatus Lloydbacteria bacterium RIFCSPHIGHO2_02_FULL_50_18]